MVLKGTVTSDGCQFMSQVPWASSTPHTPSRSGRCDAEGAGPASQFAAVSDSQLG